MGTTIEAGKIGGILVSFDRPGDKVVGLIVLQGILQRRRPSTGPK
jgi:hypothetical protein